MFHNVTAYVNKNWSKATLVVSKLKDNMGKLWCDPFRDAGCDFLYNKGEVNLLLGYSMSVLILTVSR